MSGSSDTVARAVAEAHRRGWGLVLAATVRTTRDLDLAEECVQEAYAEALVGWTRDGVPDRPEAWLIATARRRAIDQIRRAATLRRKLPLLITDLTEPEEDAVDEHILVADEPEAALPDERLRLIFLCCHPALAQEAQLALTLRLVCGLTTADVARALLVSESTMAARITRAKKRIAMTRIPFRVPPAAELPDRLSGVLGVIHLLFTTGHTAPSGATLLRTDLMDTAVELARLLRRLMPDEREVWGLLALLLVTDARRDTRVDTYGALVRLQDQDRSRWDGAALAEAETLIIDGLKGGRPGRYVLQAAIASLYAEAPTFEQTDWPQLVTLYDALLTAWPSPVVALNRLVPLAMVDGPAVALDQLEVLAQDPRLADYPYLPAIRADLLRRLGRYDMAAAAYTDALRLTANEAERGYLAEMITSTAAAADQVG